MSSRALLLKNPRLNYDFTFFYTKSEPSDNSRYAMSNSLSLSRQLKDWLNGNARVTRDDSKSDLGDKGNIRHTVSVGLNADPLPTLNQNLSYRGSHEINNDRTTINSGISLYNRVRLYQGVNLQLGGSIGFNSEPDDNKKSQSYRIIYSLGVTPHKSFSFNLTGTKSHSNLSEQGQADRISSTENRRFSVSFRPVSTFVLNMAIQQVINDNNRNTLKRFSTLWSPLSAGSLGFNLAYTETQRPDDDSINKGLSASVRWEIRHATDLDLTYSQTKNTTAFQFNEAKSMYLSLRTRF